MGPNFVVGRIMAETNRRTTNPLHGTAGAAGEWEERSATGHISL